MRGSNVDDTAPTVDLHHRHRVLDCVEGRDQVDPNYLFPLVVGKLVDWRHELNTSVVDQYVHSAKVLLDQLKHLLNLFGFAHIGAMVDDLLCTESLQIALDRLYHVAAGEAIYHDTEALFGETFSTAEADPCRTKMRLSSALSLASSPNNLPEVEPVIKATRLALLALEEAFLAIR